MKLRRLIFTFSILAVRLLAQANLIDLDWTIRYGDDPSWARTTGSEASWQSINLGISWERQNLRNGETAWVRKDFELTTSSDTDLQLLLKMGAERVDAFFNGTPIGQALDSKTIARLEVPASLVSRDKPNHLALRIVGHQWTGGSNNDIVRLITRDGKGVSPIVEVNVGPADHVFPLDADVRFTTQLSIGGAAQAVAEINATVISEFQAQEFSKTETVNASTTPQLLHWNFGRLQPGFHQIVLRYKAAEARGQKVFWVAVDPTKIPSAPNPVAGLNEYWERAKQELAAVPPQFKVTLDKQQSDSRHNVYSVEMASVEGVTLRAWYIVPIKPGRYPAVMHVPGYSSAMQVAWFCNDDDLIHLALDIRGHGRSADVINPGFGTPGFVAYRVNEPEHFVYKGAYLDCGRALEFLATRFEVDQSRIAVEGGSQGGGLAYASAALYPDRVKACIAGMPFLGDFVTHIAIRDLYRAEMQTSLEKLPGTTWSDIYRSMNLIDTVHLAPRVSCPVLMGTGLFDDDCPSRIGFAVYNMIKAPKSYVVYPDDSHLLGKRWGEDSGAWLRKQFGMPQH